jgi:hypothetical protein
LTRIGCFSISSHRRSNALERRMKGADLSDIDRLDPPSVILEPTSGTGVGVDTAVIHRNTSGQDFRREP